MATQIDVSHLQRGGYSAATQGWPDKGKVGHTGPPPTLQSGLVIFCRQKVWKWVERGGKLFHKILMVRPGAGGGVYTYYRWKSSSRRFSFLWCTNCSKLLNPIGRNVVDHQMKCSWNADNTSARQLFAASISISISISSRVSPPKKNYFHWCQIVPRANKKNSAL